MRDLILFLCIFTIFFNDLSYFVDKHSKVIQAISSAAISSKYLTRRLSSSVTEHLSSAIFIVIEVNPEKAFPTADYYIAEKADTALAKIVDEMNLFSPKLQAFEEI